MGNPKLGKNGFFADFTVYFNPNLNVSGEEEIISPSDMLHQATD
jgi:hypothetical protein